ncbi:MAG TPA: hypothetical protein VKX16_03715 [Chloroflexota bacterium]|nr:hypothetical protein [Chloroflexota bacterium]
MALEDFVEPEVGIAVAVTALAASPQVRNTVRRGLVVGLAGLMRAGDALSGAARGAAASAQQAAASAGSVAQDARAQAASPTPARRRSTRSEGAAENE